MTKTTDEQRDEAKKKFIDQNRWSLAKQFLDRSDHAADIIRGILFTAATAAIGFISHQRQGAALQSHLVPICLLGAAAILIFISWDIQKGKAIKRYEALRDGKQDYEPKDTRPWYMNNYGLDRIAFGLICLGVIWEIVISLHTPCTTSYDVLSRILGHC